MSANWPKPGIANVGEYQVSGRPFLKYAQAFPRGWASSTTLYDDITNSGYIDFPYITQKIFITNKDSNNRAIRISFASLNLPDDTTPANSAVKVAKNYIEIAVNNTLELDIKIKRLFITGVAGTVDGIHIRAELTHINDQYDLTQAAQDAADLGKGGLSGIADDVEPN